MRTPVFPKIKLNLRKLVAVAICLTSSVMIFSQDVITLKNGDEIETIIQEVGTTDIKYKKFDNPDGPVYTLGRSEILKIRYENGSELMFDETEDETAESVYVEEEPVEPELSYKNGVYQNGYKIKPYQVQEIMAVNTEALLCYNGGRSLYVVGQVIGLPSAFLFGWDIGTRIGGGKGNGKLLGIGAAGTLVGMIISFSGEGKMKSAVQLYNSKTNDKISYQINFGLTQSGVGLCLRF